jgi:hypothetical protein
MIKSPKYWDKRFIYIPEQGTDSEVNERIAKAAVLAKQLAERQYQAYPRMRSTGLLKESVVTEVNGKREFITTPAILKSEGTAYFTLYNTAEYASTAEARAVYVTMQRGLIFYAANRVQTKFPDLGVRFTYMPQAEHGLPHIYDIPLLEISSKENITGPWSKPGTNMRARRRDERRRANLLRRFRERNLG